MSKREWWEDIKAKLSPSPRVASQASVISPERIRSAGQGTTNEPAPAGEGDHLAWYRDDLPKGEPFKLSSAGMAVRGPKDWGLNARSRARFVRLRGACLTLDVNGVVDTWHPKFWEPSCD
jgi:hypothetical protein